MGRMDSITQGLLGAVTAQLGFRQRIGRDATWMACGAAIVPDLDMFVAPFLSVTGGETDGMASVLIHRGLSHSLLMAPLLSLPIALLWWWFRTRNRRKLNNAADAIPTSDAGSLAGNSQRGGRPPPFTLLYFCVLVAVFTHSLLDWCTSYGTQLLSPLTNTRYAIHAVPIVDIAYTPLLILTLATCYIARKIARGRAVRATLIIGWTGMLLSIGYLAAGRMLHNWAAAKAASINGDKKIVRSDAYPVLGSIFLWRTVVETEDEWIVMRAHFFNRRPPDTWPRRSVAKSDNTWVRKARDLPDYQTYNWFAGGRIRASYSPEGDHHVVRFHDMRYGWPLDNPESLWPLTVIYGPDGAMLHVSRARGPHMRDRRTFLSQAWADIWNP